MSESVQGCDSVDERARQVLLELKWLQGGTKRGGVVLANLDGKLLAELEEAALTVAAKAGRHWKIKTHDQSVVSSREAAKGRKTA